MIQGDFYEEIQSFCDLPFNKIIVNAHCDVSMCCHQVHQLGRVGKDTNVLDIWNGDKAKDIRKKTLDGKLHSACSSAGSCPYLLKDKRNLNIERYKNSRYPRHLEICLPDKHCNVGGENPNEDNPACIMCCRNFQILNKKDNTKFICEKSLCLMSHLDRFTVLGVSEPFWKDATFKVMDYLNWDDHSDHILFSTNTNGICLTEKVSRKFFERVPTSEISFSLDASTPETYKKIRRLDVYNTVIKNLSNWLKMRDEYGGKNNHEVWIYNNINLLNVHEMTQMVEVAIDLEVDRMIMLPTYDQAGVVQLGELVMCRKNVDIFKRESEKAMGFAKKNNFNLFYSKKFDIVKSPSQYVQIEGLN